MEEDKRAARREGGRMQLITLLARKLVEEALRESLVADESTQHEGRADSVSPPGDLNGSS